MPKLYAEKKNRQRTMKKKEDELGEYYKLNTSYETAKKEPAPPTRLLMTRCSKCRKEFEKGDKVYTESIVKHLCHKCKKKQITAEQL